MSERDLFGKVLNLRELQKQHLHHSACIHNLPPEEQVRLRGKTVEWWTEVIGALPEQITPEQWETEPPILPEEWYYVTTTDTDRAWKQLSEPDSSKSSEGSWSPRTSETSTTRSTDSPTSPESSDPKATSSQDGPTPTGSASLRSGSADLAPAPSSPEGDDSAGVRRG